MNDVRIILSGLWIALMLTYLLGDVLRIFAGDFAAGEMDGVKATQVTWMGAALIMLIPIVMLVLSLIAGYPAIRWQASSSLPCSSSSIWPVCPTTASMTTS